jgi:hypothetical protein
MGYFLPTRKYPAAAMTMIAPAMKAIVVAGSPPAGGSPIGGVVGGAVTSDVGVTSVPVGSGVASPVACGTSPVTAIAKRPNPSGPAEKRALPFSSPSASTGDRLPRAVGVAEQGYLVCVQPAPRARWQGPTNRSPTLLKLSSAAL